MKELDFKKDVEIDCNQLDVEWLLLPQLISSYGRALAEANSRLRKAEQKEKMVRSELILLAGEKGEKVLGAGVKPTAQSIEAYFRSHPDHIAAKEELLAAAEEAEMLQNAFNAINSKKPALENLSRLYLANYFSTPRDPRDLGEIYKERLQQAREEADSHTRERVVSSMSRRETGEPGRARARNR